MTVVDALQVIVPSVNPDFELRNRLAIPRDAPYSLGLETTESNDAVS